MITFLLTPVLTVLKRIAKSPEEISDTLWQLRQKSEQPGYKRTSSAIDFPFESHSLTC
jgi:hypothetical protein